MEKFNLYSSHNTFKSITKPRFRPGCSHNQFYVKWQNTEQEGSWHFAKVLGFVQDERTFPIAFLHQARTMKAVSLKTGVDLRSIRSNFHSFWI